MAVLAKVGTLRELPSVLVDPCLYYCCTMHQALAALRSLCTEGCVRTVRLTCVGVRNVIREFIWTAATLLYAQIRTGFYDLYLSCTHCIHLHNEVQCIHTHTHMYIHIHIHTHTYTYTHRLAHTYVYMYVCLPKLRYVNFLYAEFL